MGKCCFPIDYNNNKVFFLMTEPRVASLVRVEKTEIEWKEIAFAIGKWAVLRIIPKKFRIALVAGYAVFRG